MRCLILGGTGFLGVNLTNLLINLGNEVTVFSSGANKDFLDYGLKAKFVCGDFKDRNLIDSLSRNGFDYIFHLISTTKPSNLDPYSEFTDNVLPTINLLESVKKSSELKKIIFISSGGTVYGIPEKLPITEEHDCNPISLYPEFPIYLYIAGFRRQFSSPSRSKTSLWRPKISPSQTFPVDEL